MEKGLGRGRGRGNRGRWTTLLALLGYLVAGGMGGPGAGAQPPAAPPPGAAEEILLGPVVVTATKTPEPLAEVAESVTLIPRREIEERRAVDTLDVLRGVPGTIVEQQGSRGGLTAVRIRGGESNFTSVLFDGFRVTPPGGGLFNFADLEPSWVDRIEVLRGPQSPLYGSDAASGVINFLCRPGEPGSPTAVTASGRAGSLSLYEETATLRSGFDRGGIFLSASRLDTSGQRRNDGYFRTTGFSCLRLDLTPRLQMGATLYGMSRRADSTSNQGATNSDFRLPPGFTDQELNAFLKDEAELYGLRFTYEAARWLNFALRLHRYDTFAEFNDQPDRLEPASRFVSKTDEERAAADFQTNLILREGPAGRERWKNTLTLGLEVEYEGFRRTTESGTTSVTTTSIRRSRNVRSLYGQDRLKLGESLILTAGGRYEDFNDVPNDETGKLSAAYLWPSLGFKLRGGIGEGIKRPSFTDVFGFSTFVGNRKLKPEEQQSWEVGAEEHLPGTPLRLGATYFNNDFRDFIAFSFAGFPGGTNFENISKVHSRGLELEAAYLPPRGLGARASVTLMKTKVTDDRGGLGGSDFVQGEELLRRPEVFGTLSLTYRTERLTASLDWNAVGSRDDLDFRPFVTGENNFRAIRRDNAGYNRVDLGVGLDLIRDHKWVGGGFVPWAKGFTLEAKVNNLLDEDYDEALNFVAPGVNYWVGFRLTF